MCEVIEHEIYVHVWMYIYVSVSEHDVYMCVYMQVCVRVLDMYTSNVWVGDS